MTEKQLRFAPIIRVSTESQEKRGESLNTQKKQIISYVESLNGKIPERCWKYSGQEHSTPGHERKLLDQLLADSSNNKFDAVIVCDPSRWSRDNAKSKKGLNILKKNGVQFFVGTTEHDLYDPNASLMLGIFTEFNEWSAKIQSQKSIINRIERAKKGMPTGGKLPFGRIFDKEKNEWSLDKEKAANIQWAATEYLKGGSIKKIAGTLNMNIPNLWKILTKRSDDNWMIRFRLPESNIDETVTLKIPRLLPPATINAIKEKAKANKTYTHGHIKHRYLLSRMIFCGHCGYAMFGQCNHSKNRYYRHARHRAKSCDHQSLWVRADDIEIAVFSQLFSTLGNVPLVNKAIERARPKKKQIAHLQKSYERLQDTLNKLEKKKERLVDAVADGLIVGQDVKLKMDKIKSDIDQHTDQLENIKDQLGNVPSEKQIRKRANMWKAVLKKAYSGYSSIKKMDYADKRNLIELALGGVGPTGERYGVYIKKDSSGVINYEIRGNLPAISYEGDLPMNDLELIDILNIDTEYQSLKAAREELSNVKQVMLGVYQYKPFRNFTIS